MNSGRLFKSLAVAYFYMPGYDRYGDEKGAVKKRPVQKQEPVREPYQMRFDFDQPEKT
jgi:hypothetical protein